MFQLPPRSPLFPYTTLFRSLSRGHAVRLPPAGQRHRPESTPPGRGAHDHDVLEHAAVTGLVAERRPRPPARGGPARPRLAGGLRSEEHTSELQSLAYLVCRL